MNIQNKAIQIADLVKEFDILLTAGALDISSEATARSWIEKLLNIFDWNCLNPYEVDQEISLGKQEVENLNEINSTHRRPDYLLCAKSKSLVFIDAKKIGTNLEYDKKSAFQVRSYGWSAGHAYAIVTNFKEISIYDCRYKPLKDQNADVARVAHITYDKFIDRFNDIFNHLDKNKILTGLAFEKYKLTERPTGSLTLDEDFSEHIREWRLNFANDIFKNNKSIEFISESTQLLIDRIIFCRVAEGLKVIDTDFLLNISEGSTSWKKLKLYFSSECFEKFGGILFEDKKIFDKIYVRDELISKFIESLYYPNPYKFDVITPALLGNIYERYLGRKLVIKGSKVTDDFKEEYQKTKGAVYTPDYIVRAVCAKTLNPLMLKKSVAEIKKLKILDPSCGSGSFLLGIFDFLSDFLVEKYSKENLSEKDRRSFWTNPRTGKSQMRVFAKRELINNCICGVDIDPQAVEISRLSLSLKALESASVEPIAMLELGLLDSILLDGIGQNIKLGNSLVDSRINTYFDDLSQNDTAALRNLKIFDWKENFKFLNDKDGFDAIVGNPPYIEIKHYKKNSPLMHKYLSDSGDYSSCGSGKTDIAMPFIERSLNFLNSNGRLGFIVQTRFFKTDYGEYARKMLSDSRSIEEITDFGSLKVFEKRTTYTSIIILSKSNVKKLVYTKIDNLEQIEDKLLDGSKFNLINFTESNNLGKNPWFFVYPDLKNLRARLLNSCGTFDQMGDSASINVGLQVLFKKCYLIKGEVKKGKICGENSNGNSVTLEKESCRALATNRKFFPYKNIENNNFAIFPYEIAKQSKVQGLGTNDLICKPLNHNSFSKKFPLAGKYLTNMKSLIQSEVVTNPGADWILYTREQNHVLQSLPKILIPSTSQDSSATVDVSGDFYQDNVRMNSVVIQNASAEQYKAIAAIINSQIYDCLAKITSESLDNGYIQLNKQFILPVPIPIKYVLERKSLVSALSKIYDEMNKLSNDYYIAEDRETKESLKSILIATEIKLNNLVNEKIYQLSSLDLSILRKYGTRSNIVYSIDQQQNSAVELDFIEDAEAV